MKKEIIQIFNMTKETKRAHGLLVVKDFHVL